MKRTTFVPMLILFLAHAQTLFSQGELIPREKSAYAGEIAYAAGQHSSGVGPGLAVSFGGVVDFSGGYSWITAKEHIPGVADLSTALSFGFALHLLKASDSNPVTLSAMAGYQSQSFNIEFFGDTQSISTWLYGPAVHLSLKGSSSDYAILSIAYLFVSQDGADSMLELNEVPHMVNVSLPLAFEGEGDIVVLRPSLSFSSAGTVFGLSLAYVGIFSQ